MRKDIDIIKEKYNIKDLADLAGIDYKTEKNGDLLIKSPANPSQKTESLRVRADYRGNYNYFKDFFSGEKGDILNFTEYYFNKNTKEAVELLKDVFNERNLQNINEVKEKNQNFIQQRKSQRGHNIEILKVQPIQNKVLIDYLQKRGIDQETTRKANLQEIYYRNNGKNYFAIAFENQSKGYEIRNPYFKGSFGQKDITFFKQNGSKEMNIFEGFLDYATAVKLSDGKVLKQNNLILNSVALVDRAIELIKEKKEDFEKVKLYLDNDHAGKKAGDKIKTEFEKENIEVLDMSVYYNSCKDLNDLLQNKIKEKEEQLER